MKRFGMLMVAMLGTGALATGAQAHTQSAMAGHGWPNHFDTCFGTSFAMVVNNCSTGGPRLFIVPIQVPGSANYQASVRASGAPAYNKTSCQAMAIGPSNEGWSFSALRTTNVGLTPQTLSLGPIGVPPQGTAHFECRLGEWISDLNGGGSGGRLISVELN